MPGFRARVLELNHAELANPVDERIPADPLLERDDRLADRHFPAHRIRKPDRQTFPNLQRRKYGSLDTVGEFSSWLELAFHSLERHR